MEGRRYYVCVDEGVYGNWRAIGVLEDLTADEDVANFLVTLYSRQKQGDGEESSLRCVVCHCPLTLYCSTCQCPSHLTLPTQRPPPSLSSPPPPPPPQVLDTSAPASVPTHTDHTPPLTKHTLSNDVKDEEDTADLPQEEGDCDFDLDVVKTESSVSACDNELRSTTEPAVTVHFVPTTRAKRRKSRKRWTRKSAKASGVEIYDRSTTPNTRAKKASTCSLSDKNESAGKVLLTDTHVQSAQKKKNALPEAKQVVNKGNKEEACFQNDCDGNDGHATQEPPNHTLRKRKPCASQDLEKGHILPAEERRLAQVHVYDQSFIDRHRPEDESIDSCQPEKKQARQALIVKSVPRKRGRKKKRACSIRRPASPRSSSSEEDTVDYQISDGQSDHLPQTTQKSDDDFRSEPANDDDSRLNLTPDGKEGSDPDQRLNQGGKAGHEKYPALKHILSSPKVESRALDDEGNSNDRQPFRILVSAQKILPLLTSSGNPAHNFYSYFECAHCRKAFTHKRAFNSHVQAHIDKRIYKCTFCDRSFERPCDRIIHEKRHKYECEVCGYKYLEYSMIKEHMKLHVMKCPGCAFETSDFDAYKKHKSTCECLKPTLQCEICGVRLKSQKALSFHIAAIHQNNRPFKCSMCDKSFVLQTKLNSHMRDVHAEGGKRFHCDKCGYRSFHAHSLKIHQMCVHSSERPHKCPHCPSAFARKVYLTIHLRKHTGEKPHRCSECLQTFTQRASLTRHIRTHHHAESSDGKKLTDPQCAH